MAKLLFPHAYKLGEQDREEDYRSPWEGTYYPADEIIKLFKLEGINLLRKKYECDDVEFFRQFSPVCRIFSPIFSLHRIYERAKT